MSTGAVPSTLSADDCGLVARALLLLGRVAGVPRADHLRDLARAFTCAAQAGGVDMLLRPRPQPTQWLYPRPVGPGDGSGATR